MKKLMEQKVTNKYNEQVGWTIPHYVIQSSVSILNKTNLFQEGTDLYLFLAVFVL